MALITENFCCESPQDTHIINNNLWILIKLDILEQHDCLWSQRPTSWGDNWMKVGT